MTSFSEKVVVYGPAFPMNLTPLWVAYDKGFFHEEGVDVTLEAVLGIPDAQHPRHQWRKEGKVVFASPGGSPMFRSVREKRGPEDSDINVISVSDRAAHVFVAQAHIEDPSQLKNLFVGGMSQLVRCRLQLSVELSAIPGKATIRADHHQHQH